MQAIMQLLFSLFGKTRTLFLTLCNMMHDLYPVGEKKLLNLLYKTSFVCQNCTVE